MMDLTAGKSASDHGQVAAQDNLGFDGLDGLDGLTLSPATLYRQQARTSPDGRIQRVLPVDEDCLDPGATIELERCESEDLTWLDNIIRHNDTVSHNHRNGPAADRESE